MAQPGVAEVNGPTTHDSVKVEHQPSPAIQSLEAQQHAQQPADMSIAVASKRKRDDETDAGQTAQGERPTPNGTPAINGSSAPALKHTKAEIETFLKLLQRWAYQTSLISWPFTLLMPFFPQLPIYLLPSIISRMFDHVFSSAKRPSFIPQGRVSLPRVVFAAASS